MGPMDNRELLIDGLGKLGVSASDKAIEKFMLYLAELKKWNRTYSITSIKDDRDVIVSHFLDSAIYLKGLDASVTSVADIGSGGGFPGIPLKILRPELEMHLVEPTGKKVSFLQSMAVRLKLDNVTVHNKRMEQCDTLSVDAAVTRALFNAQEFCQKARMVVRQGGRIVLSKGPKYEAELAGVDFKYEVTDVELPFSEATRHIIVISV